MDNQQTVEQNNINGTIPPIPQDTGNIQFQSNLPSEEEVDKVKHKRKRLIWILIIVFLIIIVVGSIYIYIISVGKISTTKNNKISLTMWGISQPASSYTNLINQFEKQNPNVSINYVQIPSQYYESFLVNKLKSGVSLPDIVSIGNTYLPLVKNYLYPAPPSIYNMKNFSNEFYKTATEDLTSNNQIYAAPNSYDGLALLYNKTEFQSAGLTTPSSDFNTFVSEIPKLVVKNSSGRVTQAAIDIGQNTSNVYNASNILTLFMLMSGTKMTSQNQVTFANGVTGADALNEYLQISKVDGWSSQFPSAISAFANGSVAMIYAPAWQIANILTINKNLNLGVMEPPQLPGQSVNLSLYFARAVPRGSLHPNTAWEFIKFLEQKQNLVSLANTETKVEGEPVANIFPRMDMASLATTYNYMPAFVKMAPTSQSWLMGDYANVSGILDNVIEQNITLKQAQSEVLKILIDIYNGTYKMPPQE